MKDRYAVVVATSVTWPNYRHQADAMAMYQLLKRHGYDDDHIILILENNLADNPNNLYPGVVKVYPNGENLNVDVKVDYKISDLKISDLSDILTGRKSDRLPIVLNSGASDNVIVFWCGHGNRGLLEWGEQSYIRGWQVSDILKQMKSEGRFRKMMFVTEACYSGSIAEACEGTQGVLFLTAARADEISLADIPDEEMGIYLSDGFTRVFQETIESEPTISIHDLYLKLARGTIGSHAMIYNYKNYGNIYTNNLREYL